MEEVVDLQEYLDILPFPAFILDCNKFEPRVGNDSPSAESINFVFVNKACSDPTLGGFVEKEIKQNRLFREWLCLNHADGTSIRGQEFFESNEFEFSFNFLRDRYKVVNTRPRVALRGTRPSVPISISGRTASWTKAWSRYTPQTNASLHRQHLEYLLAKDWSQTPLGPLEDWPQSLRTMSSYVMNCPFPCAMYWGEDLSVLYNHEYIAIAQDKHPHVLGQPYRLTWPELWAENLGIKQRLLKGLSTGESTRKDNDPLFLCRSNIANEECYIDWCLVPFPREPGQPGSEIGEEGIVRGTVDFRIAEKGRVGGLVNPVFENTNRVLMDRRLRLLRELGARVSVARVTNEFWGIVMRELREAELDVPGVVAYGVSNEGDGILRVVGHIGLDGGHDFFPETLDLNSLSDIGVQSYVKQILDGDPVIIEGESVLSSFEPRGWGDPLTKAILVPIKPSTTRPPQGVLFFVLSPRRPYDEDYALFIELLTRQIATSLTNVQLFEEEIRRGREIAEADRRKGEELERALAQRTRELRASQGFMGRLAEICPVGIFVSDPQGNITFVNDSWYEITSYPRSLNPSNWLSHLHPEDVENISKLWHRVLRGPPTISCEFRWIHPADEGYASSSEIVSWCSMAVAPEMDDEGNLIRVFGAIVDISDRKHAEQEQKRRLEESVEVRRQQENFIDMTSHEMRNPLSAILQSSDTVLQCLIRAKQKLTPVISPPELDDALEAIHTVMLCSNHQKRIIDDTLTMSKLDSRLLLVTPVDTQPVKVVEKAMKMFENDFANKDITAQLIVDPSYDALGIDWVKADPSRFTQVLVNLLSNAIKFTAGRPVRNITVKVGPVSTSRPGIYATDEIIISSPNVSPPTEREKIFITFSVTDTGSGLSDDERALLFQRFTQAKPETHVTYGGSGLGLYICRKLTELQGGQITVQSRQGEGSTFSFYIEAKFADPPIPAHGDKLDPTTLAAAELTNARTEASFLPNNLAYGKTSQKSSDSRRSSADNKPSYYILIVEDNLVNQQVLAKQLQLADCTSAIAKNGLEALDILSKSSFARNAPPNAPTYDICLMDIEMPVMDGITACHRIRELEQTGDIVRRVPLIAVTANARVEQIERMKNEGFDDVLTKPFRVPDLLRTVDILFKSFIENGWKREKSN